MCLLRAAGLAAIFSLGGLLFPGDSHSSIVQFSFTGTITAAFDNDPNTSPDNVFGAEVVNGDMVTGYFIIDTNAGVTQSQSGFNGQGSASAYEQFAPLKISATMDGVTFASDGTFLTTVVNDFVNAAGDAPVDIFGVGDGVESGLQNLTGDTILVDGSVETGRLSLQFNDFTTADAFGSDDLPSTLDLTAFDSTEGRINGTNDQGVFGFATFSVDSITVSVVPEPGSTAALLALCFVGVARRRRA